MGTTRVAAPEPFKLPPRTLNEAPDPTPVNAKPSAAMEAGNASATEPATREAAHKSGAMALPTATTAPARALPESAAPRHIEGLLQHNTDTPSRIRHMAHTPIMCSTWWPNTRGARKPGSRRPVHMSQSSN